jgi:putative methanogenesis marker protein 8
LSDQPNKTPCDVCGAHEIYCCGSRVQISRNGIEALTEPMVDYCPLHGTLFGTKDIDAKTVCKNVHMKVERYGFCCRNRQFDTEPTVAYGASEMMCVWLENGLIDCAVIVCEGAGTVTATKGKLVQAIGARLTGIIKTSPISEIIDRIEAEGGMVLDKVSAKIDQVEGLKRALGSGHKRIAVSVAGFQAQAMSEIRRVEADTASDVLVFSVCNTCVRNTDLAHIAKADIVCASASKILRKEIGKKALLQLGVTIPVYALTEKGKKLILAYLAEFRHNLVIFRTDRLPYLVKGKGPILKKRNRSHKLQAPTSQIGEYKDKEEKSMIVTRRKV